MDHFASLERQTAPARERLQATPLIRRALDGDVSRRQYLAFLGEAYHHVSHTVPLLMACGSRLPSRLEWLREAVVHYIGEEYGHQDWIANDIAAAGGDAEAVREGRPKPATELMLAYAYDTIARRNPVGLFGMVYVLEGTSVTVASHVAHRLRASLDLPATAFTYLDSHGALDREHIEYFRKLVNRLDDPDDRAALVHCAEIFFRLYGEVIASAEGTGA